MPQHRKAGRQGNRRREHGSINLQWGGVKMGVLRGESSSKPFFILFLFCIGFLPLNALQK